jgi:hypothetical protein
MLDGRVLDDEVVEGIGAVMPGLGGDRMSGERCAESADMLDGRVLDDEVEGTM